MAKAPKLITTKQIFASNVKSALFLASRCRSFFEVKQGINRKIEKKCIYLIYELAFLQLYLAWEDFLEQSFIKYMCNGASPNGYKPNRFVSPVSMDHAYQMLKGKKGYVEWHLPEEIHQRAVLLFKDGRPYEPAISSAAVELQQMNVIRNAIAHRSPISKKRLKDAVRGILGFCPYRLGPGLFLYRTDNNTGVTFLKKYASLILTVAGQIVP